MAIVPNLENLHLNQTVVPISLQSITIKKTLMFVNLLPLLDSTDLKNLKQVSRTFSCELIPEFIRFKGRLSCGIKHDQLVELTSVLGTESIPPFLGFTNAQIQSLFSAKTKEIWLQIQNKVHSILLLPEATRQRALYELETPAGEILRSIESDILTQPLPLTDPQKRAFAYFKGKKVIVRSSSNEGGNRVNAGRYKSISCRSGEEQAVQFALAEVIASYFDLKPSLKNLEEVREFPICSAFMMEQISESAEDPFPIVSGVMMTSKTAWSAPKEEGITHIAASWGFASGTSNKVVCDEWAITHDRIYPTIHRKPYRFINTSLKEANKSSIREIPCLNEKQLNALKILAKKLEVHFKVPVNVEFVIKGDQIYVVQAQPIRAPNIVETTYLNPERISDFSICYHGKMIVPGSNRVLFLHKSEIVFAKNLEEAWATYNYKSHKAVVVYTDENSNTHAAVNFDSERPSVPCLVLPHHKWTQCEPYRCIDRLFQLCPQTGTLVQVSSELPVCKGLFLHPARFPISIDTGNSLQEESTHPTIHLLKQLLRALPEVLLSRIGEIETQLILIFSELQKRTMTDRLIVAEQKIKLSCFEELEGMKLAARNRQMTLLSFHASMLSQLIDQPKTGAIGAHSLSGIEAVTKLPEFISHFIQKNIDSQLLCELALLGRHGFDEQIQNRWIHFLELNLDQSKLQLLHTDLQELEALDMCVHWFSIHFASPSLPNMDQLLDYNKRHNHPVVLALKALAEPMKKVSCVKDLEQLWHTLKQESNAFLAFCRENRVKHPFIVDLIDLWDLGVKILRTSHLLEEHQVHAQFKDRVDSFIEFALQASDSHVLNYSLYNLIRSLDAGGNSHKFSVQHWLLPLSHGALGRIETDDQRLTVIHQNLLQAASIGELDHFPLKLRAVYEIFENQRTTSAKRFSSNSGTFISFEKDRASIRINIPLNFHSTVVTLNQRKLHNEIEVIVYFRASDNWRGQHLNYFRCFSYLTGISLVDSEIASSDLKVVFHLKNEEQATLLAKAINQINASSLTISDDIYGLCFLLDPEEKCPEAIEERITTFLWEELNRSGQFLHLSGMNTKTMMQEFLEKNHLFSQLVDRVILELIGKHPLTDFGREFQKIVLKKLPIEKAKEIIWINLNGDQTIYVHNIPESIQDELLTRLFEENPNKTRQMCRHSFYPEIFTKLMTLNLEGKGLKTVEEAALLFRMVVNCRYRIPEKWIQALKAWDRKDIDRIISEETSTYHFRDDNLEFLLKALT